MDTFYETPAYPVLNSKKSSCYLNVQVLRTVTSTKYMNSFLISCLIYHANNLSDAISGFDLCDVQSNTRVRGPLMVLSKAACLFLTQMSIRECPLWKKADPVSRTLKSITLLYLRLSSGIQTLVSYGIPARLSMATVTTLVRPAKKSCTCSNIFPQDIYA